MTASVQKATTAVFLGVVAFTYASIWRGLDDGNSWARMATVFAVVERGVLNIDPDVREGKTGDWARAGGHYYSNKAPGPALLAIPIYAVQRLAHRALGLADDVPAARHGAGWVANFFVSIVPSVIAVALMRDLLRRRYGLAEGPSFILCGAWALGSLALPNSVVFFGHQSAAAFLAVGVCLSLREIEREEGPRAGRAALAGLAMGLAAISDYLCAALVGVWVAFLAWKHGRLLGAWVLGAVPPAAAALAYHGACFGSPFRTAYDLALLNPEFVPLAAWELPSLRRLADITVSPWRGLFYCTPVFLLIFLAPFRLREEARRRPEMIAAAAGVILYFGLLSAFPSAFGGFCIGPRYFTPALVFALILLVPAARIAPRLLAVLAAASAVMMLAASLTEPLPNQEILDPFRDLIFPTLGSGGPTLVRNVFSVWLGWDLRVAFAAYLMVWAGVAAWIAVRLRREAPAAGGTA